MQLKGIVQIPTDIGEKKTLLLAAAADTGCAAALLLLAGGLLFFFKTARAPRMATRPRAAARIFDFAELGCC